MSGGARRDRRKGCAVHSSRTLPGAILESANHAVTGVLAVPVAVQHHVGHTRWHCQLSRPSLLTVHLRAQGSGETPGLTCAMCALLSITHTLPDRGS